MFLTFVTPSTKLSTAIQNQESPRSTKSWNSLVWIYANPLKPGSSHLHGVLLQSQEMPIKGDALQRGPGEAELAVASVDSFQQVHFLPMGCFDLGIALCLLLY